MTSRFFLAFGAIALATLSVARAQFVFPLLPSIVVTEPPHPKDFDPYYNQSKTYTGRPTIYTPSPVHYETKQKRSGDKITETITIRDQYGEVIYRGKETKKNKES